MLKRVIKLYVEGKENNRVLDSSASDISENMNSHISLIPDYLRFGVKTTAFIYCFLFFLFTTKRFKIKSFKKNRKWKLPIFKDFIKFLDSIYEIKY